MTPAARDRFRGRHIGVVLQQFHLLPTLTALQNLLVAQTITGLPADRAAAQSMLAALGVGDVSACLSAPALDRPAAARRHRPRARQPAPARARRRADIEPRRRGVRRRRRSAARGGERARRVAARGNARFAAEIADTSAARVARAVPTRAAPHEPRATRLELSARPSARYAAQRAAAGAGCGHDRLRADRRRTGRRQPQPRRPGHRSRRRRQGQPHPADPLGNLPSRRAHRQHSAGVGAGARRQSAGQACRSPCRSRDSFRGYWILGTTPDYIDLYGGTFAVGPDLDRQDAGGAWRHGRRDARSSASATASSARTASPKVGPCTAIRSTRWSAS